MKKREMFLFINLQVTSSLASRNRINRTPFRRRSRLEVCVSVFVCIIRTDERYLNTPVDI